MRPNARGFTLIEIMVAVAILGVVSLGMAALFSSVVRMQSRTNTQASMTEMKRTIQSIVMDQQAWRQTIDYNVAQGTGDMGCLKNNTQCLPLPQANPNLPPAGATRMISLTDADGNVVINTTGNTGFKLSGEPCTGYQPEPNANPDCPIRYNVYWNSECTGNCVNPNVRVWAMPTFASRNDSTGSPLADIATLNLDRYKVDIRRGSGSKYDAIVMHFEDRTPPYDSGDDSCNQGQWKARRLNTVVFDAGTNLRNATAINAAANGLSTFVLGMGRYECSISAPAFKSGGARLRIRTVAGTPVGDPVQGIAGPGAVSSQYATAIVTVQANFNLLQDTTLTIEQYCETTGSAANYPGTTSPTQFDFGVPVRGPGGSYTNPRPVYTQVTCVRTS